MRQCFFSTSSPVLHYFLYLVRCFKVFYFKFQSLDQIDQLKIKNHSKFQYIFLPTVCFRSNRCAYCMLIFLHDECEDLGCANFHKKFAQNLSTVETFMKP